MSTNPQAAQPLAQRASSFIQSHRQALILTAAATTAIVGAASAYYLLGSSTSTSTSTTGETEVEKRERREKRRTRRERKGEEKKEDKEETNEVEGEFRSRGFGRELGRVGVGRRGCGEGVESWEELTALGGESGAHAGRLSGELVTAARAGAAPRWVSRSVASRTRLVQGAGLG